MSEWWGSKKKYGWAFRAEANRHSAKKLLILVPTQFGAQIHPAAAAAWPGDEGRLRPGRDGQLAVGATGGESELGTS